MMGGRAGKQEMISYMQVVLQQIQVVVGCYTAGKRPVPCDGSERQRVIRFVGC